MYDHILYKLGKIKNPEVKQECDREEKDEEVSFHQKIEGMKFEKPDNEYNDDMMDLNDLDEIPKVPSSAHNAISINLYCIDDLYESRGIDFLNYAFKLFPNRDYIILTQPYTFPESSLLQIFTRIPKKKDSVFGHVLHIFHKDFLWSPTIEVFQTKMQDFEEMQYLIDNVEDKELIEGRTIKAIESPSSDFLPYTVFCNE